MEEQIKRVVKSQKIQYISFWIIPLLLVLLGEAGVLPVGIKADNVRAVYVFETIGEHNGTLFVYDDKIGHNAPFYCEKHPEEWNDELEGRCWYLAKDKIKILKKVLI